MERQCYPPDVSDDDWAFVAPYLTLMREDAPNCEYSLREVFNALRWVARAGAPWRFLPHDFPPWSTVYQQAQRWFAAGVFVVIVADRRAVLGLLDRREADPSAIILASRTLPSSRESGGRAGDEGPKSGAGAKFTGR